MSTQTAESNTAKHKIPLPERDANENERNAMRAYLQRTEVRLSTLHRIAVAFVGGAGLLILFPIFLKDEFGSLLRVFISYSVNSLPMLPASDQWTAIAMLLLLAYPFMLSAVIPLYALYLLLKDIIHFYFTIYTPGFPASLFTPSFVLSGITFSPDESQDIKRQIYARQYHPNTTNFMIPFSAEKRELYFDETIESTNGEIIPQSRQWHMLQASGGVSPEADRRTIEHFNTAFGLARTLDRKLLDEVAVAEASTVRHVLYLRRLVLRYVKTLLMFIWTTVISFVMLPFLQESKLPTFLCMAIGFLIWSVFVMMIMKLPTNWIYRHRREQVNQKHIDKQITMLEQYVSGWCYAAVAFSALGLAVAIIFYT
jgi:hypothetical protein